jgi:hypothetical protein
MTEHPHRWDYSQSRAVVVGTWDFREFQRLPAAKRSFQRFAGMLTGPLCGWPNGSVTRVPNEPHPGNIGDLLIKEFKAARDVALFYYVGHGQIDSQNELCLALTGSERRDEDRRAATSLTFTAVRDALLKSEARTKIIILDCCFAGQVILKLNVLSGAATNVVADEDLSSLLVDKARTNGAYVMAAAGPYTEAQHEQTGPRPQTYFTKHLVDLVERGIVGGPPELTLGALYGSLEQSLVADGRPHPEERNLGYGYNYVFARNAAAISRQRGNAVLTAPGPRGRPPLAESPPAAAPSFPTGRLRRPRGRRRALQVTIAGISATVVAAAAAFAVSALRPPHAISSSRTPLTHTFALAADHGLDVQRHWTVTDTSRPTLTETLTVTNPTGAPLKSALDEPVPAAASADFGSAHFTPVTPQVLHSGQVLDWQFSVPAHKSATYGYTADLGSTAVSTAEFGLWITQFAAALAVIEKPAARSGLRSLAVRPGEVRLKVGGSAQLTVGGVLANGKQETAAALSAVIWQSADPQVAGVTRAGKIIAESPGSAVITVSLGTVSTSIRVVVSARTGTPTPTPTIGSTNSDTYQPPPAQQSSSAASSPATNPPASNPAPSPTVIVTTPSQI